MKMSLRYFYTLALKNIFFFFFVMLSPLKELLTLDRKRKHSPKRRAKAPESIFYYALFLFSSPLLSKCSFNTNFGCLKQMQRTPKSVHNVTGTPYWEMGWIELKRGLINLSTQAMGPLGIFLLLYLERMKEKGLGSPLFFLRLKRVSTSLTHPC